MRNIIGLIVGLYLLVALVVAGGAVYRFMFDPAPPVVACAPEELAINTETGRTDIVDEPLAGGPDWVPWALWRAAIWPKAFLDDQGKTENVIDWLLVRYDPFGGACP